MQACGQPQSPSGVKTGEGHERQQQQQQMFVHQQQNVDHRKCGPTAEWVGGLVIEQKAEVLDAFFT